MIRVIYTWKVPSDHLEQFQARWRETTRRIHDQTPGALGSFCLKSVERPDEVLTIALWQTQAQWRSFIKTAKSDSMKTLHEIATQIAAEAYEQLGDETISPENIQRPR